MLSAYLHWTLPPLILKLNYIFWATILIHLPCSNHLDFDAHDQPKKSRKQMDENENQDELSRPGMR